MVIVVGELQRRSRVHFRAHKISDDSDSASFECFRDNSLRSLVFLRVSSRVDSDITKENRDFHGECRETLA